MRTHMTAADLRVGDKIDVAGATYTVWETTVTHHEIVTLVIQNMEVAPDVRSSEDALVIVINMSSDTQVKLAC